MRFFTFISFQNHVNQIRWENISIHTSPDRSVCDAVLSRSNGGKERVETSGDDDPSGTLLANTSSFSRARLWNQSKFNK